MYTIHDCSQPAVEANMNMLAIAKYNVHYSYSSWLH